MREQSGDPVPSSPKNKNNEKTRKTAAEGEEGSVVRKSILKVKTVGVHENGKIKKSKMGRSPATLAATSMAERSSITWADAPEEPAAEGEVGNPRGTLVELVYVEEYKNAEPRTFMKVLCCFQSR